MNTLPLSAGPLASGLSTRKTEPMAPPPPSDRDERNGGRKPANNLGLPQPLRRTAHDLRGPLNTILLNLELLRESFAGGEGEDAGSRQERYVSVIGAEVLRLNGMLDALFGQLGILQQETERFDLREAVSNLSSLFPDYARRKRVELRFCLPEMALEFEGNREVVQDAMIGLLMYAVEAMPGGGELEVKLEAADGAAVLSITGPTLGATEIGPDSTAVRHLVRDRGAALRILREGRSRPAIELELPLLKSPS
jgi:hypothetical protein